MPLKSLRIALLPAAAALAQTIVAIDNPQVRVLIAHVQPHAPTAMHEHKDNRVMIFLDPGTEIIKYQSGKVSNLQWPAGKVDWSPADGMHSAEITSAKPVTIVEIELKKPGKPASPAVPNADPEHFKVELENDQARVLRLKLGPRQSTPLHKYELNRVVITGTKVTWAGPEARKEENPTDQEYEALIVELKN